MLESKMSARLKQVLSSVFFQNIETTTGLGVPDLFFAYKDISGWIELKELRKAPRDIVNIPWRQGQIAWYKQYRKKTISPYLLILTIDTDWYVINNIKEQYTMDEIKQYFIANNKKLLSKRLILFKNIIDK